MTTRMSKNNFVPAVIVLAAVCLSCTLLKGRSNSSPYGVADISKVSFPAVDPDTPFPAVSTEMIDALVIDVPELSQHRDKVLEAEREAINGLLADIRAKSKAANALVISPVIEQPGRYQRRIESDTTSTAELLPRISLIPAAYAAEQAPEIPNMG